MMKYHALLLAPIFACLFAAPASSQAVVDNPGICAQIYPDADCENYGPGNPDTAGYSNRGLSAANAFVAAPARHHPQRKSDTH
jgi:hypothetical protein